MTELEAKLAESEARAAENYRLYEALRAETQQAIETAERAIEKGRATEAGAAALRAALEVWRSLLIVLDNQPKRNEIIELRMETVALLDRSDAGKGLLDAVRQAKKALKAWDDAHGCDREGCICQAGRAALGLLGKAGV